MSNRAERRAAAHAKLDQLHQRQQQQQSNPAVMTVAAALHSRTCGTGRPSRSPRARPHRRLGTTNRQSL